MKLFVNGYGSPMHGWDWFVCGEVRNTKKEAAQDLRELKQKLKQLDELQKQLTDARNALLREGMQRDELLSDLAEAKRSAEFNFEQYQDVGRLLHEECEKTEKLLAAMIHIQQVACSGSPELGIAIDAIASVKGKQ